jgi:antitoxin CptB
MLELDILLARFIDAYGASLSKTDEELLNDLLDYADNELWDLISGQTKSDDKRLNALLTQIRRAETND